MKAGLLSLEFLRNSTATLIAGHSSYICLTSENTSLAYDVVGFFGVAVTGFMLWGLYDFGKKQILGLR